MRRALILLAFALPSLSACGGNDADSKVTETRMDDIDSVEGTISDEMIPTDEVTEMAPVEASAAPAATAPKADDKPVADKPAAPPTTEPAPKAGE
ncbi:hypothetical protein [uncultured Sphingorhabdus sp.]|uniref:hypothetical protein n=1 Tax=uncultured Sphingorhabdus sp. TaxID=1686106 RepID=UPI00260D8092|nr:hypothetical protein [uncultured Sphingorhabdus sp.]HMS20230.1 hypothetical protein [Sphingorhabdus sp.]